MQQRAGTRDIGARRADYTRKYPSTVFTRVTRWLPLLFSDTKPGLKHAASGRYGCIFYSAAWGAL